MQVGQIYNPQVQAQDQYTVISHEERTVQDSGMTYRLVHTVVTNSARNLENGAKLKELELTSVYKIKKDGTLGQKLTNWNKRLWEIAQ